MIINSAARGCVDQSAKESFEDRRAIKIGTFSYLKVAGRNEVKRFVFATKGVFVSECAPRSHKEVDSNQLSCDGN